MEEDLKYNRPIDEGKELYKGKDKKNEEWDSLWGNKLTKNWIWANKIRFIKRRRAIYASYKGWSNANKRDIKLLPYAGGNFLWLIIKVNSAVKGCKIWKNGFTL